ncbi:MAG: PqqD family protein [Deltaproteobacteria bacterium]|nr:PqqD family protein [Deltaproteobacteria bacterium]
MSVAPAGTGVAGAAASHASPIGPGAVPRPREALAWQEVAGEVVILDLDGMVLRGLNRSGGRAFQLMDGRRTLADIAEALAARYSIDVERALGDVLEFAAELVRRGLLEEVGGAGTPPARGAGELPR